MDPHQAVVYPDSISYTLEPQKKGCCVNPRLINFLFNDDSAFTLLRAVVGEELREDFYLLK